MTGAIDAGDGCRISWAIDGPADAPVLLLINSLGTTRALWEPQLDAFSRRRRVLRFDMRGHGASDVPTGDYGLDRLGRDALALLDALGVARVDVCGLSLGGMVGQWLGVFAPERVDRLVLACTAARIAPASAWQARIAAVRAGGMAAVAEAVLERWFTAAFRARDAAAVGALHAQLLSVDPMGYSGACAAIRDLDLRRLGGLITSPALVIAGRHDRATPSEHAYALASAIPGSSVTMLDAAHLANVEQAEAFAATVLTFLGTD